MFRIVLYQMWSRKMWPVLLLCSTYFIGELHHLFSDTHVSNWILFADKPMTDAWNMKYLAEEINRIIEGLSFLLMLLMRKGATELYALVIIEYLVYRIVDIAAYFIDYKTDHYWQAVLLIMVISCFFYLKKK